MGLDITGLGSIAEAASSIANKIWPDKTEVEKAKLAATVQDAMNEFGLAKGQQEINLEEAKSAKTFVAGWRPFIGWVCGTGLAYQLIFMPIMNGLLMALFKITPFVSLDTATLSATVSGMLGLGALRTYEKYTGVEGKRAK
jgi:hypothetical protein